LGLPAQPESGFVVDIWRSLQSLLIGYAFGLPALALLLVLSFLVPYAAVVLFPLKMLVAAMTVAWDLCDYPLSVAGRPVGERVATVFRHFPAVIGFGLGIALAGLVPCLLFVLLPGGVAGATRLMGEVERWEAAHEFP
jgi:CysZ protein